MRALPNLGFMAVLIMLLIMVTLTGGCGTQVTQPAPQPAPTQPAQPAQPTPPAQPVKAIELHLSHFMSPMHHLHLDAYEPFAKEVEEKTQGRVKIFIHPGGSLTPAAEHYEAAASGVIDIGHVVLGYTPGRFPITGVCELPFMFNSGVHTVKVLTELYKTEPALQKEYSDVKIIWFGSLDPGQILTTSPIKTLSDLKGKKLRSPGPMQNKALEALGAVPVSMPITDVYDAIERGIIDGAVTTASTIESYKFHEVVKYICLVDIYTVPQLAAMNLDSWKKISAEDQKIIDEIAASFWLKHGESYDKAGEKGLALAKEKGIEINKLSEADLQEVRRLLAPLADGWIQDMNKKGIAGEAIYKKTVELAQKYK